jgi:hypothetical protein
MGPSECATTTYDGHMRATGREQSTVQRVHGHEETAKLCARFVSHTFSCPETLPSTPPPSIGLSTPNAPPAAPATLVHFVAYAPHRTRLHASVTHTAFVSAPPSTSTSALGARKNAHPRERTTPLARTTRSGHGEGAWGGAASARAMTAHDDHALRPREGARRGTTSTPSEHARDIRSRRGQRAHAHDDHAGRTQRTRERTTTA